MSIYCHIYKNELRTTKVNNYDMAVWILARKGINFPMAVALIGMMTSSNEDILHVTGPLCGEFTGPGDFPTQRQVTRSFDVYFDLRPNKRLSKQSWGWWFETLSYPLRRHCNGLHMPGVK